MKNDVDKIKEEIQKNEETKVKVIVDDEKPSFLYKIIIIVIFILLFPHSIYIYTILWTFTNFISSKNMFIKAFKETSKIVVILGIIFLLIIGMCFGSLLGS